MENTDIVSAGDSNVMARNISVITAEIQFYKNQAGEAILEIGHRLIEAKEQLQHGEWLAWLQESVDFSEGTAQRFMRIAREYSNPALVTDLGVAKAVALLALPSADRDEFIAENPVVDMGKRELEQAIRERKEALEAKEAAEQQAEKRLQELIAAENQASMAEAEAQRAQNAKEQLERELELLQKMKSELPPEPDHQTLDAVRKEAAAAAKKEAEEKLRRKIDKATADKDAAEIERQQAEQELERVKSAHEQEQAALAGKVRQLEGQLTEAGSQTVAVFKTHFESVQVSLNKMLDCIQDAEDDATREKLSAALGALCKKVLEKVEV